MRIWKRVFKLFFWLLIVALLVAPLGLIYGISNREMERYTTPDAPQFRETALGAPFQAQRMDVAEAVSVSGCFVSREFVDQELPYPASLIRWQVEAGQEVSAGQQLGSLRGEALPCQYDGVVEQINIYPEANAYLRIRLLEPIELECLVTDKVLRALQRATQLCTAEGEAVELAYASRVKTADGLTTVRLSIDSEDYSYGMELEELTLLTGHSYLQALVLSSKCVYQKTEGEEQPWYARRVSADGYFIEEVEVEVGYRDERLVCVSGVTEGDWFDTGYQALAREKAQ